MQQLEPAKPMTEQRPARILVIDDEITQRMLVKEYLEEAGYVVRLSDDGRRGLKMAAATNPDLIILDLMLPSMDGYTLCTCLKQADSTAHIPIILVTAAREPGVIERGLAAGADDFVTKPVDWAFLADRVRFVLARAKEQQFAAAVAAPAGASAPRTESAADKARLEEAAATAEAARAELSMLKEQIGAERQRSDLQHRTALDAARAELAALKEAAAADRAKSGEQHNAALDAARAGIEARARLEIDALKARHNDELAAVRALAARDQDTLRAALKAEIARAEQRHAGELAALRLEAESLIKEHKAAAEAGAKSAERRAEERQNAQIRAIKQDVERQLDALRSMYEAQLADASLQHEKALAEAQRTIEELHESSAAAAAAASVPDEKLLRLESECADRVLACWEFARGTSVAHIDMLASLMGRIRSYANAEAARNPDAGQSGHIESIMQAGRELSTSMGKQRMLAQIMSGTADFRETACDLAKLVGDAVNSVKELANSQKITLGVLLPDQPVVVRADQARLLYALVSVLANAIRFTPAGGAVSVSLEPGHAGVIRLEVADTGIGIAPAHLESLRSCLDRPGHVLAGRSGGIGFGVPIASALVRQHGGWVEIDSGLGKGTRFAIHLPCGMRRQACGTDGLKLKQAAS